MTCLKPMSSGKRAGWGKPARFPDDSFIRCLLISSQASVFFCCHLPDLSTLSVRSGASARNSSLCPPCLCGKNSPPQKNVEKLSFRPRNPEHPANRKKYFRPPFSTFSPLRALRVLRVRLFSSPPLCPPCLCGESSPPPKNVEKLSFQAQFIALYREPKKIFKPRFSTFFPDNTVQLSNLLRVFARFVGGLFCSPLRALCGLGVRHFSPPPLRHCELRGRPSP